MSMTLLNFPTTWELIYFALIQCQGHGHAESCKRAFCRQKKKSSEKKIERERDREDFPFLYVTSETARNIQDRDFLCAQQQHSEAPNLTV